MTIDEAIKHAENVALNSENGLYDAIALGGQNPPQEEIDECMKCAEEHRQLAEWLKELKMYKSADEQDDDRLYIKIYADDEPSRKAEKLYQICGETERQEVAQWLKEYFPSADRPTGEWVRLEREENVYDLHGVPTWGVNYMCDKCGFITTAIQDHFEQYKFCPHCGKRLVIER